jgi:hypothetical protein
VELDLSGILQITDAYLITKDLEVFIQASTGNTTAIASVTLQSLVSSEELSDLDAEEVVFEPPSVPWFSIDPPSMIVELMAPSQILEIQLPEILDAGNDFCRMVVFSKTFGEMTWNYCGSKTVLLEQPIKYDALSNSLTINITQELVGINTIRVRINDEEANSRTYYFDVDIVLPEESD